MYETLTNEQILQAEELDWRIQRRALAMRDSAGTETLTEPLQGYRAIVRADTDEVFQIATPRYEPLQNMDVVGFFRSYCDAAGVELAQVGSLDGGRKVYAQARLPLADADLSGDRAKSYLTMATSHDGSIATTAHPAATWIVCMNTLRAAVAEGRGQQYRFTMKHTREFTPAVADEARQLMDKATEQLIAHHERVARFTRVNLSDDERVQFVARVLGGESALDIITQEATPLTGSLLDAITDGHTAKGETETTRTGKRILEAIVSSPGSDLLSRNGTLWGAINGVTYFADHLRGKDQSRRADSAMFGAGAALKAQALQVAAQWTGYRA